MKIALLLLAISLATPPLAAQVAPAGLRQVHVNTMRRGAGLARDSSAAPGWERGMEIGAGTGAGYYFLILFLFGGAASDGAGFHPKPFLITTAVFAAIGGLVGAIVSGR